MRRVSALTTGPPIDPPSAWVDSEDRPYRPCCTPGCSGQSNDVTRSCPECTNEVGRQIRAKQIERARG